MIQIITNTFVSVEQKNSVKKLIEYNKFSDYKSFDLFDINIIDLNSDSIWETKTNSYENILNCKELKLFSQSLKTSKAKIIISLPQNKMIQFNYSFNRYNNSKDLKTIPDIIERIVKKIIPDYLTHVFFERNISTIQNLKYNSDFYFDEESTVASNILLRCDKSRKINTIKLQKNLIITTLNFLSNMNDVNIIIAFLNQVGFMQQQTTIPDWIKDIQFYNDKELISENDKNKQEIQKINEKIENNNKELETNNQYKSILYLSGTALADQINNMLGKIFDLNPEEFVDKYEEDFNFKKNNITFIVETKGLNNEVVGKNVSDAYDHVIIYEDQLEQEKKEEKVKGLFFVASERNKKPEERAKIKERQITIAKRNNMLIIDTPTFYKMFEDFCQKKLSTEEIFKIFKEQVGLINYEGK